VEVASNAGISPESFDCGAKQRLFEDGGTVDTLRERESLIAELCVRVKENGFVYEVLSKEGTVEVRTSFEEDAEDLALGEHGEDGGKREATGMVGDDFNLNAVSREAFNL